MARAAQEEEGVGMGAEADAVMDLLEDRHCQSLAYDPAEGVVGSGLTHGRANCLTHGRG